jgi:hypothetical protein
MTTLERDYEIATSDAEQLAKTQIVLAITYLSQGLSYDLCDIRSLLDEIVSEFPRRPRLRVVAGSRYRQ